MEEDRLPAPLVGMLKASKLTGKAFYLRSYTSSSLGTWLHQLQRSPRNDNQRRQPKQHLPIDSLHQSLQLHSCLQNSLRQLKLRQLQFRLHLRFVSPAPKRCHLKWQLDGWGINLPNQPHQLHRRRTNAPSRRLHQLQNALPRRQTRPQTTTLPRFNAVPCQNRLPTSSTRP